jgi:hypothetical protein
MIGNFDQPGLSGRKQGGSLTMATVPIEYLVVEFPGGSIID